MNTNLLDIYKFFSLVVVVFYVKFYLTNTYKYRSKFGWVITNKWFPEILSIKMESIQRED